MFRKHKFVSSLSKFCCKNLQNVIYLSYIRLPNLESLFRISGRRKSTPRAKTTTAATTTPVSLTTTKVPRRRLPTLVVKTSTIQDGPTTSRSPNKRVRFPPRTTSTRKTAKRINGTSTPLDQHIESSNQQSLEEDFSNVDTTELADIASALQNIQQAPLPKSKPSRIAQVNPLRNPPVFPVTTPKVVISTRSPSKPRFTYTTGTPVTYATKSSRTNSRQKAFEKIIPTSANIFHAAEDYDYYEDGEGVLAAIPEHSKVLLHSNGVIECLDQGNFPHPVSCKKFISCAKMDAGKVLGWEYTCPKNLSFDPIGGICNWSAGLGCNE